MSSPFKSVWSWIVAAFGILIGMLFWERNRRKNAEAKVSLGDAELQDVVLKAKIKGDLDEIKIIEDQEQQILNRKPVDLNLNAEQIKDFYKKIEKK